MSHLIICVWYLTRSVYGALLGTQSGRDIDIHTTFEMIVKPSKGGESSRKEVDHEFLTARQAQCKCLYRHPASPSSCISLLTALHLYSQAGVPHL